MSWVMMTMTTDKYEYIRALHERFCEMNPMREELSLKKAHKRLHSSLSRKQRKLLLAMVDAQSLLQEQVSLESFALGFQLGMGICQELKTYSFIADMEQRAMHRMTDKDRP